MKRLSPRSLKLALLVCLIFLFGFGEIQVPPVADLDPIYAPPTISLAEKEAVLFDALIGGHLNRYGYLLYRSFLPLSKRNNYQRSHNSADLPAWHGHWMAALAMKLALEPSEEVEELLRGAVTGLRKNFRATGIRGLLGRSYLKYSGDDPLPWMVTEEERPTRFWQKGENGFWFRNGVSKSHYGGAVFGLGTVVALDNGGAISLEPGTRGSVDKTLKEIAHYLIDNDYRIVDANGEVTEFGRLDDWRLNGFDGLQILAMLRACAATGSEKCAREYARLVEADASKTIEKTLGALGDLYAYFGRENFDHFGDDEAIYTNAFTLYINSDEGDWRVVRHVRRTLEKMWQFLRYSRKSYMTFVQDVLVGVSEEEREEALDTLRMFPASKRVIFDLALEDTDEVQPIANQAISSHYWKSNYFRRATRTASSKPKKVEYSGQDYLSAYWMGRFFDLISEEEATTDIDW
jgi:hypothetical protein